MRAPRAVINSVLQSPERWAAHLSSPERVCGNVLRSLDARNALPQAHVHLIKYEDLGIRRTLPNDQYGKENVENRYK